VLEVDVGSLEVLGDVLGSVQDQAGAPPGHDFNRQVEVLSKLMYLTSISSDLAHSLPQPSQAAWAATPINEDGASVTAAPIRDQPERL
jgi:hypothetical protein